MLRLRGAVFVAAICSVACLGCVQLMVGLSEGRQEFEQYGTNFVLGRPLTWTGESTASAQNSTWDGAQQTVAPEVLASLRYLEEPLGEGAGCQKIYHAAYTVAYSPEWQQARWVAYSLTQDKLMKVVTREAGRFKPDPAVRNPTVNNDDYRHSGYDKGHLAPAGDMVGSSQAMRESYYFSNISPQLPNFNRGIWKKLEERVRRIAMSGDEVYVATGPYFHQGDRGHIGYPPIAVPTHFYKALLVRHGNEWQAVAYAIPHMAALKEPNAFMISVDSLERFTGLDFFPLLPDSLEARVEGRVDRTRWE